MTKEELTIKKINAEVRRYIEDEILPKYRGLRGHTDQHINDVIRRSLIIANGLEDIDYDMVYVIAAYHDLGRLVDNEMHHIESAKMLRADDNLKFFFDEKQIEIMAEAVEDHRASLGHEPRNIYGRIVSCADRSTDVCEPLARAYDYEKSLHPDWSEREVIECVRVHLREKYSSGGYALKTMYFDNPDFSKMVNKIEEITATPEKFFKIQTEFNYERATKKDNGVIIFGASRKGYEIAKDRFGAKYKVVKIDPDGLSELKKSYSKLIDDKTPIIVFGPVGSNVIPIGREVYITESRFNDDFSSSFSRNLDKPRLKNAPKLGVPCYTSETFVTETNIKEPVVFDRVLAYLIRDGFNVVSSWRIVSDNLSREQFDEFKKNTC